MYLNIELLEQSFEKLKPCADEFTASFYENLFAANPQIKLLFANTDMAIQRKKLFNVLVLIVESFRNSEALEPVIKTLGARHVGYGVVPKYYPALGKVLLVTLKQYLQQDWTPEVKQAWVAAFKAISAVMLKGAGVDYIPKEVELETNEISKKQPVPAPATQNGHQLEQVTEEKPEQLPVKLQEKTVAQIKLPAAEFVALTYEKSLAIEPEAEPLTKKQPELTDAERTRQQLEEVIEQESEALPVEILEKTFALIKPRASEFVASFYENLFAAHPEIKPLFGSTDMEIQRKKLLNTLVLVVESLRNPEVLTPVLSSLGARHVGYGAIPKYYGPIAQALLMTFEQYLQQDWTPEVKRAWAAAFKAISAVMLKGAGVNYIPKEPKAEPLTKKQPELTDAERTRQQLEEVIEQESEALPVEILEKTFALIKPRADEFVASFYENLFAAHPEIKPLFGSTDMEIQRKKLLNTLVLVVEGLRNPEVLTPVLSALGARHVGYGAIPKYYGSVVKALLMTFEQYLQQDWTPEVKRAWVAAFKSITAVMLKGTSEVSSPTVVQDQKAPTIKKPSQPKPEIKIESQQLQPQVEPSKKLQQSGEILKEHTAKITSNAGQLVANIKKIPARIIDTFWELPPWSIALFATVIMCLIFVFEDENSALGKILGGTDAISLVVAVVLFIKEAPDRKKQYHYQAWSIIDGAAGLKVSYARLLAMQDLNKDGVSLRELNAPGAELDDINLPGANLSEANFSEADMSNGNLSKANLSNANLSKTKLSAANLTHANLSFARLSGANLSSANLSEANLICADLSNANMSGANLKNASLSGANLNGALLIGANLKGAKVSSYDFNGAVLENAIMPDGSKYKSEQH